jgi:hypothetical protein
MDGQNMGIFKQGRKDTVKSKIINWSPRKKYKYLKKV